MRYHGKISNLNVFSGSEENFKQLKKSIFEFLTFEAPDKGSIYNIILSNNRFTPDQVLEDMFSCLYISFITTTKSILNIIKRLNENEEIKNKLKAQINDAIKSTEENKEQNEEYKSFVNVSCYFIL